MEISQRDRLVYDFLIAATRSGRGGGEGLLAVTSSQKDAVERVAGDLFGVVANAFGVSPDYSYLGKNHCYIATEKFGFRVVKFNPDAFTIGFADVVVICRPDGVG